MRSRPTPRISRAALIDEYFVENRTRLLEIAAFLDRLDRHAAHATSARAPSFDASASDAAPDFRLMAFAEALDILADDAPDRLGRIQRLLSDPTTAPLEALDRKSAVGAYDRWREEGTR